MVRSFSARGFNPKQPFHLVEKRPQLRIVSFLGVLLHAGDEERIGQLYVLAAKPVIFIINLFESNADVHVIRCNFWRRIIDLISDNFKKDVD